MTGLLRDDRVATVILSWVAGYVDAAGFLKLNGLFTAHVTGNLVVAGAELAGPGTGGETVWVRLAVIPVFIAAVTMTSVIARTRPVRLSSLMWFEVVTLLVFTGLGVVVIPDLHQPVDPVAMFIVGSAGVFAMGVRNTLMRESLESLASTTMMTGNLTQLVIDLTRLEFIHDYERDSQPSLQKQEICQRLKKYSGALAAFVSGATFGALLMRVMGFWSILWAVLAIALLAWDTQRHEQIMTRTHHDSIMP